MIGQLSSNDCYCDYFILPYMCIVIHSELSSLLWARDYRSHPHSLLWQVSPESTPRKRSLQSFGELLRGDPAESGVLRDVCYGFMFRLLYCSSFVYVGLYSLSDLHLLLILYINCTLFCNSHGWWYMICFRFDSVVWLSSFHYCMLYFYASEWVVLGVVLGRGARAIASSLKRIQLVSN